MRFGEVMLGWRDSEMFGEVKRGCVSLSQVVCWVRLGEIRKG